MIDWWWSEDTHIPMSNNGDGTWSTITLVPEGELVQYVYDYGTNTKWGEPFKETREGSGRTVSIESRFLLVTPELEQVQDTVEMWQDSPAAADSVCLDQQNLSMIQSSMSPEVPLAVRS